jgi:hypothetical protein
MARPLLSLLFRPAPEALMDLPYLRPPILVTERPLTAQLLRSAPVNLLPLRPPLLAKARPLLASLFRPTPLALVD